MLVHMDNFLIYGLNGEAQLTHGVYASAGGCGINADPDVNATGTVLRVSDFGHLLRGLRYIAPVADTVTGVGWRWWIDMIPSDANDRPGVTFNNEVNAAIASVTINPGGGIDIRGGDLTGPVLASTEGPVVTASGWYQVEARLDSTADGNVTVRVEGREVLLHEHINFNTPCQGYYLAMWSANGPLNNCCYKDVFMWNNQGTRNKAFQGTLIIAKLATIADVALNWTPSAGANGYSILDNIGPNDAAYIRAPYPAPAAYVGSMSDLPLEITSVRAIMTIVRAAKADGGDGSLQNGVISAGVPVNGSDRAITVTQTYWMDVFEEDPATNAPWLPAAVNAVQIKINRTT